MSPPPLSVQQTAAYDAVQRWLQKRDKPFFYLDGVGGSGKTTVAQRLTAGRRAVYTAYTGKAADVMASRGCEGATTIHRLIYQPVGFGRDTVAAGLRAEVERLSHLNPVPQAALASAIAALRERSLSVGRGLGFELALDNPEIAACDMIVVDECFTGDTLVDTPAGPVQIQSLQAGDAILNASGIDTIVAVKRKEAKSCARINAGSKTFFCSEDHPFFTRRGLVVARDLRPDDELCSTDASVRLLWSADNSKGIKTSTILQRELRNALANAVSRVESKNVHGRARSEGRSGPEAILELWFARSRSADSANSSAQPYAEPRDGEKDKLASTRDGAQTADSWRQWASAYRPAAHYVRGFRRWLASGTRRIYRAASSWLPEPLQTRRSEPGSEDRRRIGWTVARHRRAPRFRRKAGRVSDFVRVDRVTVLKQGSPELESRRDAEGKFYLYDLQAARHHSFSVSGVLVHNCSMLSSQMAHDLFRFGKPVLVLGDTAQLPPVGAAGFFASQTPDFQLTEVHRQARESGVLQLATMIREGRRPTPGRYGTSIVTTQRAIQGDMGTLRAADQIIVGYNRTRQGLNRLMRGADAPILPVRGDKLVCLRNNHDRGFYNGSTMVAASDGWDQPGRGGRVRSRVTVLRDGVEETIDIDRAAIAGAGPGDDFDLIALDYAFALTCHKAQGSQWPRVLVFDESSVAREHAQAWLYTATSRAADQIVLALES